MFTLFTGRHVWRTKEVLQHGDSILGSVILCETFRRISQLWYNAHTLNLENCQIYLSSSIPQFFDFIRCVVFDFIFYCVTTHTLYISVNHNPMVHIQGSAHSCCEQSSLYHFHWQCYKTIDSCFWLKIITL